MKGFVSQVKRKHYRGEWLSSTSAASSTSTVLSLSGAPALSSLRNLESGFAQYPPSVALVFRDSLTQGQTQGGQPIGCGSPLF